MFIIFMDYPDGLTLSLSEISKKCTELEKAGNIGAAIQYAKMASNRFGLEGLLLYLPLQYQRIRALFDDGEIIQQDAQEALAYIFHARKEAEKQKKGKEVFELLAKIENDLIAIITDKEFIIQEAHVVADVLENLSHP